MQARGVRAANPIWWLPDLVGQPLNDQYYISFLTNTFPYLPQPIFEDVDLTIPWANPLEFFPNGTLPDNMYWDPALVWRLEIRQGPTQSDPLIYEINNFSPSGIAPNPPIPAPLFVNENQITNPQFGEINFTNDYTITTAGSYNIAPGWNLVLTGSGTTTLTQLVFSGSQDIINNPPFGLKINNSGWTSAILQQIFTMNGAIWANGAISGQILARAEVTAETITMNYVPSDAGTPSQIFSLSFGTGNFVVGGATINLPASTNTDLSSVAGVLIQLILPPTGIVDISNIQVTGQSAPIMDIPVQLPMYQQETEERQLDHKFHVFANSLITQPKQNLLTGWTFGLNPWQFTTTTQTNVAANQYTADQTIIVQQNYVASAVGNNVSVGRAFNTVNFAFLVQPLTATNKFAMIQYIDASTIAQYWGRKLSSLVQANVFSPSHSSVIKFKMRLISRFTVPPTVSQTEPIASWSNVDGSDPVFAAGWTAIKPLNDPEYTFSDIAELAFSFDQFQLPPADITATAMTLGIVLYTTTNMNPAATNDSAVFYSISLVENDFAIQASTETFDESLRKCQFYYESSYEPFTLPGTVTGDGNRTANILAGDNGGTNVAARPGNFEFLYKSVKRTLPVITIYAPNGSSNQVLVTLWNGGSIISTGNATFSADWTLNNQSTFNVNYRVASFTALLNPAGTATMPQASIFYQYTLDSRMGI
jgi:hypothetical protein